METVPSLSWICEFFFFLQLCDHLLALRRVNIQVCEIKANHILLDRNNDPRIVDLGSAHLSTETASFKPIYRRDAVQPIDRYEDALQHRHMAPELLLLNEVCPVSKITKIMVIQCNLPISRGLGVIKLKPRNIRGFRYFAISIFTPFRINKEMH